VVLRGRRPLQHVWLQNGAAPACGVGADWLPTAARNCRSRCLTRGSRCTVGGRREGCWQLRAWQHTRNLQRPQRRHVHDCHRCRLRMSKYWEVRCPHLSFAPNARTCGWKVVVVMMACWGVTGYLFSTRVCSSPSRHTSRLRGIAAKASASPLALRAPSVRACSVVIKNCGGTGEGRGGGGENSLPAATDHGSWSPPRCDHYRPHPPPPTGMPPSDTTALSVVVNGSTARDAAARTLASRSRRRNAAEDSM